ncbi:MAG: hypothetical protein DI547_16710 [Sphingobium sp.]|nr:MAG: hypothetical protein DI547_16710 [Sphingobium sp.]
MSNLIRLLFIVIISNAGGEGKTLLAQLIQALLQLAGDPVIMLDGDPGNQAAKVADDNAKVVGWGVDAIKAPDILAATNHAHVILDLGANSLASAREIVELLPALRTTFAEASYRTVAFMPVSTNKIGAVEAIKTLASKIEGFERLFVKVNRDNSRAFGGTLEGDDVIDVGHLRPGFQAYIRQPGQTMANAVAHPPKGFGLAAAQVAEWMRDFAAQPPVLDLIGSIPKTLGQHDRPVAVPGFPVNVIEHATDAALTENIRRTRVTQAIARAGFTPEGLRKVAALIESGNL